MVVVETPRQRLLLGRHGVDSALDPVPGDDSKEEEQQEDRHRVFVRKRFCGFGYLPERDDIHQGDDGQNRRQILVRSPVEHLRCLVRPVHRIQAQCENCEHNL